MKFMNMKRFGSIAMAGALALSLAAPAFAANTTVIEGGYEEIPIAVLVPEAGTAQINPYGLPVAVYKSDDSAVNIVDRKITSVPLSIRNQGDVPLDVGASLKVAPRGELVIKTSLTTNTDKGKEAKVTLEVASLNDNTLKKGLEDESIEDLLIDKFVSDATWAGLTTDNQLIAPAATAANAETVTATKSPEATPLATLGATTTGAVTGGGTQVVYGAKSIALFRLTGELNSAPKKTVDSSEVDNPWTAEDGFTATIVFNFKPAAKLAITMPTGLAAGASVTASPASAWEGTEVTLTAVPPTANPTHVPTYTVTKTGDAATTVTVTNGKFTMPDYPVTVAVTFAAP